MHKSQLGGREGVELGLELGGQFDVGDGEVLLEVRHRRGAGDQQHVGGHRQRPRQDDLCGRAAEVVSFEPRDGLRYGHRFWSDGATGLLLKARVLNERGEPIEQFAFSDLTINARIEHAMVEPSWPVVPPDWRVLESAAGEVVLEGTCWTVARMTP